MRTKINYKGSVTQDMESVNKKKLYIAKNKNIPKFYQKNVATSLLIATKYFTSFWKDGIIA